MSDSAAAQSAPPTPLAIDQAQLDGSVDFPVPAAPALCSYNECLAGHRWPPTAVIAACPGCGMPSLMIQKQQCPTCNEPCVRTVVRSDFMIKGGGVATRCRGSKVAGESIDLVMERHEWQEIESAPFVSFEARAATEAFEREKQARVAFDQERERLRNG